MLDSHNEFHSGQNRQLASTTGASVLGQERPRHRPDAPRPAVLAVVADALLERGNDPALWPHQREGLAKLSGWVGGDRSDVGLLFSWPTGVGKRRQLVEIATAFLKIGPVLVLTHTQELVEQAREEFRAKGLEAGIVMAAQNEMGHPVTIATFQSLRQRKRLMALLAGDPFSAIFVDESHHPETARQWRKILLELQEWNLGSFLVGFSATPRPRKPIDGRYLFDATVDQLSVREMCEAAFLVPPRWKRLVCRDLDLQAIRVSRSADGGKSDYGAAALSLAARDPAVLEAIVRDSGPLIQGLSTIAFCVDVAHGVALTQVLVDAGLNAAFVCADTPKEERKRLIKAFRNRELDILVNVNVLSEGFDCTHVGCIIMAAPTTSVVRFVQRLGRGLRAHPNKTDCLIIDLMPYRPDARQITLDDVVPQSETGKDRDDEEPDLIFDEPEEDEEQKKAEPRLTFLDPSTPSQFDWAEVANKTWSTAAGFDEALWIVPYHGMPDLYRAFVEDRYQKAPWWAGELSLTSEMPEPLDQCLKTADDWLRDNGELSFMRKAGRWRYEPITEKQRATLVKFLSPAELDVIESGDQPKGEAGDRITPYYARQRAKYIVGKARRITDDG